MPRRRITGARRVRKCLTCRDRKKGCDGREPSCGTCEKARKTCLGFKNQPYAVVHHKQADSSQGGSTASEGSSASQEPGRSALILRGQRTEPSIPPSVNDSSANLRNYFLLRLIDSQCSQAMMNRLCEFVHTNRSDFIHQQECIKALTASYYSNRFWDHHANRASVEAYGKAVKSVRKSLDNDTGQLEFDLIMSLMCLSLYENIAVTNPKSWNNHYGIISCLLQRYGPHFYHTEKNRGLFLAFRYAIIVSAGVERKPCFFADESWKEVIKPVGNEILFKFDNLLNIAVDIPGLLYNLDNLKAGRLSEIEHVGLTFRVAEMLLALQSWREYLPPLLVDDGTPRILGIETASGLAFHHMLLLLIEELCHLLGVPWLPPESLSTNVTFGLIQASHTPDRVERRHSLAVDILRLAQQSISKETPIYGVLTFMMPLHVAYDNIIKHSVEMEEINYLMVGVVAKQHGFHIARQHEGMYKAFEDSSVSL